MFDPDGGAGAATETLSGPESPVLAIVLDTQGQLMTDKQDFETAEWLYRALSPSSRTRGQTTPAKLLSLFGLLAVPFRHLKSRGFVRSR